MPNSVDPDHTPQYAASDEGLQYLLRFDSTSTYDKYGIKRNIWNANFSHFRSHDILRHELTSTKQSSLLHYILLNGFLNSDTLKKR